MTKNTADQPTCKLHCLQPDCRSIVTVTTNHDEAQLAGWVTWRTQPDLEPGTAWCPKHVGRV